MPDDAKAQDQETASSLTGKEKIAERAFKAALHGRKIEEGDLREVQRISRMKSPQNWVTLARAALVHAGKIKKEEFNPLVARTSTEFGSLLYDFSWSLCTYATIKTQPAIDAYTAMLAVTALCHGPAEHIELRDLSGNHRRKRNDGMAGYRGPISAIPGNRRIWNTGKSALYAERSIAAPLAAWALGQNWSWNGWNHKALGWAMEAAAPRTPEGHEHGHKVQLPSDTKSLVKLINKLKMQKSQRLEILRFPDGGLFCLLNRSTFGTRGSVLVTEYIPGEKLLREISPAQEIRQTGEWTACEAQLKTDGSWEIRQLNSPKKKLTGQVAKPKEHIVWDAEGCRFAGSSPDPDPPPDLIKELAPALDCCNQVLRELGAQSQAGSKAREKWGRTAVEVLRRIASEERASAREGTETLLGDLQKGPSTTTKPLPMKKLAEAIRLLDRVLRKLGDQSHTDSKDREARGRTATEIIRCIASETYEHALQGTKTLLKDMQSHHW